MPRRHRRRAAHAADTVDGVAGHQRRRQRPRPVAALALCRLREHHRQYHRTHRRHPHHRRHERCRLAHAEARHAGCRRHRHLHHHRQLDRPAAHGHADLHRHRPPRADRHAGAEPAVGRRPGQQWRGCPRRTLRGLRLQHLRRTGKPDGRAYLRPRHRLGGCTTRPALRSLPTRAGLPPALHPHEHHRVEQHTVVRHGPERAPDRRCRPHLPGLRAGLPDGHRPDEQRCQGPAEPAELRPGQH